MSKFEEAIKCTGSTVVLHDGNFEKAMRKFKKKVQSSGLMLELRERECYVKPTTRRKIRAGQARSRWRKYLDSQTLPEKHY
jgi:small subunit ribosomal protein S21